VNLNAVWLDQGTAVVVLANEDGSSAPRTVTNQIAPLLLREAQDHTHCGERETGAVPDSIIRIDQERHSSETKKSVCGPSAPTRRPSKAQANRPGSG